MLRRECLDIGSRRTVGGIDDVGEWTMVGVQGMLPENGGEACEFLPNLENSELNTRG